MHIAQLVAGHDDRPEVPDPARKSISAESTVNEDSTTYAELQRELLQHAMQVAGRLRADLLALSVHIELKDSDFLSHRIAPGRDAYTRPGSRQPVRPGLRAAAKARP